MKDRALFTLVLRSSSLRIALLGNSLASWAAMKRFLITFVGLSLCVGMACAYEREDYEEDAGASFQVVFNSQDDVFGIGFGAGTWLVGTPIFGDYFIGLLNNGIEDAWYSNVGMTIRIMPHWPVAPFVGAGGSYNYSFTDVSDDQNEEIRPGTVTFNGETVLLDQGDSYWGGHAEAGVRAKLPMPVRLLEVCGRYTWTSLEGERDYWLVGISTGTGF